MPRYTTTLHNRAAPDAPASISRHVPFHVAHEAAAAAWVRALGEACGDLLDPATQMAAVNVVSNFRRELFTEEAYVDLTVTRIGTTSVTLQIGIEQDGTQAAAVTATLVQLDSSRRGSAPWSPAQVAALETLSTASVTPSR